MLVKYPTLSLVAVLTLGLGIGLSTTVFCVVNGGLFKGLPFPDADRIVALVGTNPSQNQPRQPISVQDLAVWQARQTSFEEVGAYGFAPMNLSTEDGRPERFSGGQLTVAAFEALGVQPILGRGFRAGDDRPGAEPVILLGYQLWRDRYGSAPDIVGKTIRANGVFRTVIGVMPENFAFPIREAAWIPLSIDPLAKPRGRAVLPDDRASEAGRDTVGGKSSGRYDRIAAGGRFPGDESRRGRRRDAVREDRARPGDLRAALHDARRRHRRAADRVRERVEPARRARVAAAAREVAVRMALGRRAHAWCGSTSRKSSCWPPSAARIGIVLSIFGMRWFTQALSVNPPPFWITFELDYRVMLFVLGLIVLASLFAGALPALHAARVSAGAVLKDDSRSSTSASLGRFSSVLVVAELAVSCGLLIAAGLMIKSVVQLKNVKMPFAIENILTARVDLPRDTYPDSPASIRFFEQLLPRLQAVPGVEAATLSDGLPAAGNGSIPVQIEGKAYPKAQRLSARARGHRDRRLLRHVPDEGAERPRVHARRRGHSQPVAIINASFARTHFPNLDPMGRQMKRIRPGTKEPWLTIVGVVPDLLMEGIGNNNASPVGYYIPIAQSDVANGVRIAVRTRGEPAAMTSLVRSAVTSLDNDLASTKSRRCGG